MFASHRIAKGFAAAVMLTPIGYMFALAQPMWSSAAPIEYLQYDLTPYFNSLTGSFSAHQYWWPVESAYTRLFDYAPDLGVHASPMVQSQPLSYTEYVPYIGYDLTPYYNLAPGCPLTPIC